jgi:hypothetical protein
MSRKNCALADAFMKTREGKQIVSEAKNVIGPRIRELDELAYGTYVKFARPRSHFDLYKAAKPRIRELGVAGGSEYDKAALYLRSAWVDRADFERAGKFLVPDQKVRTELGYRW